MVEVEVQCPICKEYIMTETETPELDDTYAVCPACNYRGDMIITEVFEEE